MTQGMAKVHRAAMQRISSDVTPAFLDTPAGFELNCDAITAKARDYFEQEFSLPLAIASFKNADTCSPEETARAMQVLRRANYIFAGPGSPTYCVRHWRETPVFETVIARLHAGAHVTFASAAAISLGAYSLPVYEIYKVGAALHWLEGLDLLGRFGFDLAVLPHWNNNSGATTIHPVALSATRDLNCCARCCQPAQSRSASTNTPPARSTSKRAPARSAAPGTVTVLRGDERQTFGSGESFAIDLLGATRADADAPRSTTHRPLDIAFHEALETARDPAAALSAMHILMDHLLRVPHDSSAEKQSFLMIREMIAQLAVWLEFDPRLSASAKAEPEMSGKWLDLLVDLRSQLRAAKQWALADAVRNQLAANDVIIEDGPAGSTWRIGA